MNIIHCFRTIFIFRRIFFFLILGFDTIAYVGTAIGRQREGKRPFKVSSDEGLVGPTARNKKKRNKFTCGLQDRPTLPARIND